jgi:phosphoribosylformylglycinamidine synthase
MVSAHDLSDGGLAVGLAECCIGGPWATSTLGAEVDLKSHADAVSDEGWLFGEDAGRVITSVSPSNVMAMQQLAATHGVPCHYLGLVAEADGALVMRRNAQQWSWPVRRLRAIHLDAIPRRMQQAPDAGKG